RIKTHPRRIWRRQSQVQRGSLPNPIRENRIPTERSDTDARCQRHGLIPRRREPSHILHPVELQKHRVQGPVWSRIDLGRTARPLEYDRKRSPSLKDLKLVEVRIQNPHPRGIGLAWLQYDVP